MFRVNQVLRSLPPLIQEKSKVDPSDEKKMHQLFTHIAYGFDLNKPPSNVVLYRSAVSLYNKGEYSAAEHVLKDALKKAKEENCSDVVLSLYQEQIEKCQGLIKKGEKGNWKITTLAIGVFMSSFTAGYYLK